MKLVFVMGSIGAIRVADHSPISMLMVRAKQ
jgi:hypothetical protein